MLRELCFSFHLFSHCACHLFSSLSLDSSFPGYLSTVALGKRRFLVQSLLHAGRHSLRSLLRLPSGRYLVARACHLRSFCSGLISEHCIWHSRAHASCVHEQFHPLVTWKQHSRVHLNSIRPQFFQFARWTRTVLRMAAKKKKSHVRGRFRS